MRMQVAGLGNKKETEGDNGYSNHVGECNQDRQDRFYLLSPLSREIFWNNGRLISFF